MSDLAKMIQKLYLKSESKLGKHLESTGLFASDYIFNRLKQK